MTAAKPAADERPLVRFLLDLGPLAVFFLVNNFAPGAPLQRIIVATGAFMAATAVAVGWALLRHGRVSPMLALSAVMVTIFGGLTIWLQSDLFIKIKPTVYYGTVAAILGFGLWSGRPTLKLVLGSAFPGLDPRGWTLLTRNWALFFVVLGIANEAVWRNSSTDFWLGYKLWGAFPATLAFAMANVPMLMRHGLGEEEAVEDATAVPPQG